MTKCETEAEFDRLVDNFATSLQSLREYRGYTRTTLAEAAGVSRFCIYMIEEKRRTPTLYTALMLCITLGVDLGELLRERREDLYAWDSFFNGGSHEPDGGSSGDGLRQV